MNDIHFFLGLIKFFFMLGAFGYIYVLYKMSLRFFGNTVEVFTDEKRVTTREEKIIKVSTFLFTISLFLFFTLAILKGGSE